jgi:hypothetical protein
MWRRLNNEYTEFIIGSPGGCRNGCWWHKGDRQGYCFDLYRGGADYVFVAVAGIDTLRQAFMMSAISGMTVVIGHGHGEQP